MDIEQSWDAKDFFAVVVDSSELLELSVKLYENQMVLRNTISNISVML